MCVYVCVYMYMCVYNYVSTMSMTVLRQHMISMIQYLYVYMYVCIFILKLHKLKIARFRYIITDTCFQLKKIQYKCKNETCNND